MKRVIIFSAALAAGAIAGADGERGAAEESPRVAEAEVCVEKLVEVGYVGEPLPAPGALCRLSAVTNTVKGGAARWVAFDGKTWTTLDCAVEPRLKETYRIRAEFDFSGEATLVRYSVRAKDAADYSAMSADDGREWLPSPTPSKRKLTAVEVRSH